MKMMKTIYYDGISNSYMHRAMRPVVCALWVLTTASCAYAAASLTLLTWLPGDNFNDNTTGVSGDGSVVVGISGFEPYEGGDTYRAFRWTAGSGMVSLGYLPGGYNDSLTTSGDGSVIVGDIFRWTAGS